MGLGTSHSGFVRPKAEADPSASPDGGVVVREEASEDGKAEIARREKVRKPGGGD
jgi:hypothetical protein